MAAASTYKKRTHHENILKNPDSYIGSTELTQEKQWVFNESSGHMEYREVSFNPGLYKIFDEILVNARDAWVRGSEKGRTPVKHIAISLALSGATDATITVSNDGDGIIVEQHPEEKVYVPELIFGHLLTSSNYREDGEDIELTTGGKNGYGAKLTNIYSKEFTIVSNDIVTGKKYSQIWRNNMFTCEKPTITKATGKTGEVTIQFKPDLEKFPGGMSDDMIAIFHTRVIELAALTSAKVSWQGAAVPTNNFEKFVKLFIRENSSAMAYEKSGDRWEIAAVLTDQLYEGDDGTAEKRNERAISFVNGINTRKGGKHVDKVASVVLTDFCELAKKKKIVVKPGQIRDSVVFFINSVIVNPKFDSQIKENLITPVSKFGSQPIISPKFIEQLGKLGLFDEARSALDASAAKEAKKTDGKKRKTIHGIPKLTDAIWAGTAKSAECVLILTEGDSAASSAIAGLTVVGRERYGVFPLKGKLLNVKDISMAKLNANEELTAIKRIIGLEHGKTYNDIKTLRYGRVMIMTDQDHDGSHIKGLLMNLFHTEWPSLLKIGFVCTLLTPILKAFKGKRVECFYTQAAYEEWRAAGNGGTGWHVKYYKGLGTSTAQEAKEWFQVMNDAQYIWTAESDDAIHLAFNKKRADDRKTWLQGYDPTTQIDYTTKKVPIERFIHDELIHFSSADNVRSLPSAMDGLKPSQRKILFGCLKRNLRHEIKVAQLAGYVSEHAAYHHGEASLNGTIVGMAQNFVGSNNINLLRPNGQFGSRLQGGKDAASPRYIFTQLERIVDTIFRKEDMGILEYQEDDGMMVEPKYYLPVIPLITINGAKGIGTGFSVDIPSYDPRQIVALLRARLTGSIETLEGRNLDPYFYGFKGRISRSDEKTWITHGKYEFDDDKYTITITELPVGTWSSDYKEFLDKMMTAAAETGGGAGGPQPTAAEKIGLTDFEEQNTDKEVNIKLQFTTDGFMNMKTEREEFEKIFKLRETHKITNMCCFNAEEKITRYATIGDIMEAYFERRYEGYEERKKMQIATLEAEQLKLSAKARFIKAYLDKTLKIERAEDEDIVKGLKEHDLPPLDCPEKPDEIKSYDYLMSMRLDRLKASGVAELMAQVERSREQVETLKATSETELWLSDLDEFETEYETFITAREADAAEDAAANGSKKKTTVKRAAAPKKK